MPAHLVTDCMEYNNNELTVCHPVAKLQSQNHNRMSPGLRQGESYPSKKSSWMTEDCHYVREETPMPFHQRPLKDQWINLHNQCEEMLWRSHGQRGPTACVLLDMERLGQYNGGRESHPTHGDHLHTQWAPCFRRITEGPKHSKSSPTNVDCPTNPVHDHSRLLDDNDCRKA